MTRSDSTTDAAAPDLRAMEAWTAVWTEAIRFVSERLEQDLETRKALLACRTPEEVLRVQSDFYSRAMQEYAQEATRLFAATTRALTGSASLPATRLSRKYDDIPL